jgi:iron complex outermembrane receptor protein
MKEAKTMSYCRGAVGTKLYLLIMGFVLILMLLIQPEPAAAADLVATNAADLSELANMDISQLMQVKVSILGPSTSVSQTPAAVSVVTQDQIQRSGAMNIPEALRLVPGLDVAQVDSSQWAVSARGFNDTFADKLLVLQDGRDLYTPLYSGVFWDVSETMMEDIDQIEVVRGPGATLWGANAMNGVINVITKSAADTQGLLASAAGGNQQRASVAARYGGVIGSNLFYRVYGTYENHDTTMLPDGSGADNSWQIARGGFRTDWSPTGDNAVMVQGSGYAGWIDQVFGVVMPPASEVVTNAEETKVSGADLLGKWTHELSDTANFKLQAYYDYNQRNAPWVFNEQLHTFDLDFKNEFTLGERHKLDWGLGYRLTRDAEVNTSDISFVPGNATLNLYSAFAQDEIVLFPDQLRLTLGSKLEHNDYTGFEYEPGARLLWTPTAHQSFWASVSRAVRTPSRADEAIDLARPEGMPVTLLGSTAFESEELVAYEAGYRSRPLPELSVDLTAFYNDYNRLRSEDPNPANPAQFIVANNLYGRTYGAEASATWRMTEWWEWQPSYSLLKADQRSHSTIPNPSDAATIAQTEGTSPEHQFSLRSSIDLPRGVTFDTTLRYVDQLSYFQINSYFELDARLAWQINQNWQVALVGQDLLHNQHPEFGPTYVNTQAGQITEIPRSIYLKVTCRF